MLRTGTTQKYELFFLDWKKIVEVEIWKFNLKIGGINEMGGFIFHTEHNSKKSGLPYYLIYHVPWDSVLCVFILSAFPLLF